MRILFLSHVVPYPPNDGRRVRAFNMSRALAGTHEVTLFCLSEGPASESRLAPLKEIFRNVEVLELSPLPKQPWRRHLWHLVANPEPMALGPFRPEIAAHVQQLLSERRYDVLHLDTLLLARYLPETVDVPRVIDLSDAEHQRLATESRVLPFPQSVYRRIEAAKLRRYERRLWTRCGHCLAISEPIRRLVLREAPGAKAWLVPQPVDLPELTGERVAEVPDRLAYVGDYSYGPNVDAVRLFCRRVLPLVRRHHPLVTFHIVGGNPPAAVQRLAAANVVVSGFVPDVTVPLREAAVVVVPLRAGSGVKNKLLEAWALARPVVTTSVGAEGLAVCPGENALVADAPHEFAEAVQLLLADRDRRRALGEAGLETVRQCYSRARSRNLLLAAYAEIGESARR